ncbi:MAG: adenylate/guanylate cyclase domain-containing protein [Rhodospirillaceae bacterium]|nr:MAG: adenylate/guanylate cyclase domain-containing protein [Rhodospirillaceae bacterium]
MVDRPGRFNLKMVVGMVTRPTQLSTDIPANGPAGLARDRDLAQNSAGNTAESYRADPIGRALAGIAAAGGQPCAIGENGALACPAVDRAFRWLMEQGRVAADMPSFLLGLVRQLADAGFPLQRVYIGQRTLHPQIAAVGYLWNRGDEAVSVVTRDISVFASPTFINSPIRQLYEFGMKSIRRRLIGPEAKLDFPILEEMRDQGATDYAIFALNFGAIVRSSISIATDHPSGFNDAQLAGFEAILPLLAMVVEMLETRRLAGSLLEVYLGRDPGQRVLDGAIQRGEGVTIAAAIWYCDLRDFTKLSNKLPRDEVIALLNDYFDTVARPVHARGGEILKFVGDAILAIFPMHDDLDRDLKCKVALAAAEEALEAMRDLNELRASAGKRPLKIGIGLHAGSVTYGNIGVVSSDLARLDFTVIGPAVNLASRIGDLCRPLDETLLASRAFASPCGSHLVPLGEYVLRGFDEPQQVFGLPR